MNIKELQDLRDALNQAYELKKMLIRGYYPKTLEEEHIQDKFIEQSSKQIKIIQRKIDNLLQE